MRGTTELLLDPSMEGLGWNGFLVAECPLGRVSTGNTNAMRVYPLIRGVDLDYPDLGLEILGGPELRQRWEAGGKEDPQGFMWEVLREHLTLDLLLGAIAHAADEGCAAGEARLRREFRRLLGL
jgi:hypothetical protein